MLKKIKKALAKIKIDSPLVLNLVNSSFAAFIYSSMNSLYVSLQFIDTRQLNFDSHRFFKLFYNFNPVFNLSLKEIMACPNSWLWDNLSQEEFAGQSQIVLCIEDDLWLHQMLCSDEVQLNDIFCKIFNICDVIICQKLPDKYQQFNIILQEKILKSFKKIVLITVNNHFIEIKNQIISERFNLPLPIFQILPGSVYLLGAVIASFISGSGNGVMEASVMAALYFCCCTECAGELSRHRYEGRISPGGFNDVMVDAFYRVEWDKIEDAIQKWEFSL